MGDTEAQKMNFIKIWLKVKIKNLINSRFFLGLVCLIIGATLTFCYIEGLKWYSWLETGIAYANSTAYVESVQKTDSPVAEKVFDKENGVVVSDSTPQSIIKEVFGDKADEALKIAECESQFNPREGDGHLKFWKDGIEYGASYGLFQIRYLPGRPEPEKLMDNEFNALYAKYLYEKTNDWRAWTCKKVLIN